MGSFWFRLALFPFIFLCVWYLYDLTIKVFATIFLTIMIIGLLDGTLDLSSFYR